MRYIFKILVLAGEPDKALQYLMNVFQEEGEDRETYYEWFKELKVMDDICDLEVDVITDLFSAEFDEIIPSVDGVIYFLNPLNIQEFDFFEMVIPIMDKVKRDIPTIINFYDYSGILPISTTTLLESIWFNFPNLEAFVNVPPNEFNQILQCLCYAMLTGDTPLNIENAWMRFPIFINMANSYYSEQNYYYSAEAIKKASVIAELYKKEEFYIFCEQAAYLYSKINLYLEASQILKAADKRKSKNFKKLYAEAMLREGNKLFNKKDFEFAARQYENAAQWASIELKDKEFIQESFKLAINSWISACKCQTAFKILERLPHEDVISVLSEVSDKVVAAADYLKSTDQLESAKRQLYVAINTYQKEGIFDKLEKFAKKQLEVLIKIFEGQVNDRDIYNAKGTYDEIENMWETFNVEKVNIDKQLQQLVRYFIEDLNFGMSALLINKLTSLEIKKELTELSSDVEEKQKGLKKQEIEENIQQGVDVIKEYMVIEQNFIIELNTQKINEINVLIDENKYLEAGNHIKEQADFLKQLGKEEISNHLLTKSLDILIEGKLFSKFFEYFEILFDEKRKDYLSRIFPIFLNNLKEFKRAVEYEQIASILERSNKMYRNQELYTESKEISELCIRVLKDRALEIVEEESNQAGVKKALELIKKGADISSSYLENTKITFNKLYRKIAEISIQEDDLSSAHAYTDKIEDKDYKTEIHKKIVKLEADKSAVKTKQAEDVLKGEILKERLSIIKKKARDAFNDRENDLKQRRGLRRAYFKDALDLIKNKDYPKAIKIYKESAERICKTQKYNLAGVSLAVACLILMKEKKFSTMVKIIEETKEKLVNAGKLFSETFPVTLIEYISDMKKLQDETQLQEAISFLENLPLFEEELLVLYEILGKEYKKEVKVEKKAGISAGEIASIRSEINKVAKGLKKEKQDIAKRKMMRRQYWTKALEEISNNEMLGASLAYLDAVTPLANKKFYNHSAIGMIMGTLILIKEKGIETSRLTYEKNLKLLYEHKEAFEKLPEIQILKKFFYAFEYNVKPLINLCLELFQDNLILFEPELDYLRSFLGAKKEGEEKKEGISRAERGELSKLMITINQTFGNLQQQSRDIKGDAQDFFTKRKAMKKRYYDSILSLLTKRAFDIAADKYIQLATTVSKRKDFKTSSLLLLLHGLTMIKSGATTIKTKSSVNQFLDSLGLNKKTVSETFYTTLLNFIIDVKSNRFDEFIPKINNILKILPVFEEEKDIIRLLK